MASTVFTTISQGGPDNGQGSTKSTIVSTPFQKEVTVSAGSRDSTFTLPVNSYISFVNNFVTSKVSGIAQGVKLVIGDGTTDNLYSTTNNVSALGVYAPTLTESCVSAGTVVVKVTASVAGSAADLSGGKFNVVIVGGIRS